MTRNVPRLSALHLLPQPLPAAAVAPYRACERCAWHQVAADALVCTHHAVRGSIDAVSVVMARHRDGICGPDASCMSDTCA